MLENLTPEHILYLKAQLARNSLFGFTLYTQPNYLPGWVHEEICNALDRFLQGVIEKKSPRLIITMPPRHGKSELASRKFPAYALGRYPDLNIIATSYAADLASRMNRDVQRIIDQPLYYSLFPQTVLNRTNVKTVSHGAALRNSDIFEVVGHSGGYRSAGVGGGITGMGGDILIIDDPIKDRKEADSKTVRESVWDWYTSTLYTRAAPGGGILLIQTRWHMDDLAGRLLEAAKSGEGDQWEIVDFPAIATQDEKHRKKGEALHPARYDLEQLHKIKRALGSRDWSALYQQNPVPDGGSIFQRDWLRRYKPFELPETWDKEIISWDMTFKDTDGTDFVVGTVWGAKGANYYLLDLVRGQWDFVATLKEVIKLHKKYPHILRTLVEDKANGPAVISMLKKKIAGLIPVEPDGSKTARAHAVSPVFESGNVYIPEDGAYDWVTGYVDEMVQFPSSAHDDMVDSTTQAIRDLTAKTPMKIDPAVLAKSAQRRPQRPGRRRY